MVAEKIRNFQERYPDFNPNDFKTGEQIIVYTNNQWSAVLLSAELRIKGDKIIAPTGSGDLELKIPPKKIIWPPAPAIPGALNRISLDGHIYEYDQSVCNIDQDTGATVYELTDVNSGDKKTGVSAELLSNFAELEKTKLSIEALITEIKKVVDIRQKDLLVKHNILVEKAEKLIREFGLPDTWDDKEAGEVSAIGKKVDELRRQLISEMIVFEQEISNCINSSGDVAVIKQQRELAKVTADHLEAKEKREIKKQEGVEKTTFEAEHKLWKVAKDKWVEYNKMGKAKGKTKAQEWNDTYPGDPVPTNPGTEPVRKDIDKDEAIAKADWSYFESLVPTNEIRVEVEKRRKEKAVKLGFSGGDYPRGDLSGTSDEIDEAMDFREVSIKFMKEVINEWKDKTIEKEFDFKQERVSMVDKLKKLRDEIATYPPDLKLEADVKLVEDWLLTVKEIDPNNEAEFLLKWEAIKNIELVVYRKKLSRESSAEIVERKIDVPHDILMKVFENRETEVQDLMRNIYERSLSEESVTTTAVIKGSLKKLFETPPDEKILSSLKSCGIKNWDNFKKLLDGQMGENLVKVLSVMAQEHLKTEVANNTSGWDKFKATYQLMIAKIGTSIALVGGGTLAVSALFATGGLAGVGLAAAGGATGGFVRGLLNKFAFGHKKVKEHTAQKMKELEERKKQEFINKMMTDSFSHSMFVASTNEEFSSIMAQCLRESTKEPDLSIEDPKEATALNANARRLYEQSIKDLKMEGVDVSVIQKREFARALYSMQSRTEELVKRASGKDSEGKIKSFFKDLAGPNSDPVLIQLLTGSMKAFSGNMESTAMALSFSTIIGAGVGYAMATENVIARSILGGIGGTLMGYQIGEGRRIKQERNKGLTELTNDFKDAKGKLVEFNNGGMPDDKKAELIEKIIKFKGILRGGKKFIETDKSKAGGVKVIKEKDQPFILALESDPNLRKQLENFVYEAEKAGVLVEKETSRDLGKALARLEEREKAIVKECESKLGSRIKKMFGKNWKRLYWSAAGAVVGILGANLLGEGFQMARTKITGGSFMDDYLPGAGQRFSKASEFLGLSSPEEIPATHSFDWDNIFNKVKKWLGPPATIAGVGGGQDAFGPPVPDATPEQPVHEPVSGGGETKTGNTVGENTSDLPKVKSNLEEVAPPTEDAVSSADRWFNSSEFNEFATENNLTRGEYNFIQKLINEYNYPTDRDNLTALLKAGEMASGNKTDVFEHLSRSNVNNPIKALSEVRGHIIDTLAKEGKIDQAIDFIQEECKNIRPSGLKVLGISSLDDEVGLRRVVEGFASGDKDASRGMYDFLKQGAYKELQPLINDQGVLQIKGVGGNNPRFLDIEDGKIVGGQMRGYEVKSILLETEQKSQLLDRLNKEDSLQMENRSSGSSQQVPQVEKAIPWESPGGINKGDTIRFSEQMETNSEAVRSVNHFRPGEQVSVVENPNTLNSDYLDPMIKAGAVVVENNNGELYPVYAIQDDQEVFHLYHADAKDLIPTGINDYGADLVQQGLDSARGSSVGTSDLLKDQQLLADYLKETGSELYTREVVMKDGVLKSISEQKIGSSGISEADKVIVSEFAPDATPPDATPKVDTTPAVEPVGEVDINPETKLWFEMAPEARYAIAVNEVQAQWDGKIDQINFKGELSSENVKSGFDDYLKIQRNNNVGFSDQAMNKTQMVDSLADKLDDGLSQEYKFILAENPPAGQAVAFISENEETNSILKFTSKQGNVYLLQSDEYIFKNGANGELLMENENGELVPAECSIVGEKIIVTPIEGLAKAE